MLGYVQLVTHDALLYKPPFEPFGLKAGTAGGPIRDNSAYCSIPLSHFARARELGLLLAIGTISLCVIQFRAEQHVAPLFRGSGFPSTEFRAKKWVPSYLYIVHM